MKIKIEKPKENKWDLEFPCLAISKTNNDIIVLFTEYGRGVCVSKGDRKIDMFVIGWDMSEFMPYAPNKPEEKPIDWDKVELPIWVEDKDDIITQIVRISETEISDLTITDRETIFQSRLFITPKQKTEYLKSLKVIPKGTKITFEL